MLSQSSHGAYRPSLQDVDVKIQEQIVYWRGKGQVGCKGENTRANPILEGGKSGEITQPVISTATRRPSKGKISQKMNLNKNCMRQKELQFDFWNFFQK